MKTPLLATIYNLLGLLGILAGVLCIMLGIAMPNEIQGGIMIGVIALFSGIISLGISEVITIIAKIEYNTASGSGSGPEKVMREMSATLKALSQTMKASVDLPPVPGSEKYYLSIEGIIDCPYRMKDIVELRSKGALDGEALYISERGKEWGKVSEIN